ncbi:ABC transporter substrate-binding protein [Geminicoccus roseus]|uniref:ABC transporter substrate-binding protein n=1 Tax=Geminicoccus roseus TaxID=404900 RepID=UPI00041D0421|nr:sugar ABC transporter substrate-binding protein [Geminicoccus roseus]
MWKDIRAGRRALLTGIAGAATATAFVPRHASARTKIRFAWPFINGPKGIEDLAARFNEQSRSVEVEVEIVPQLQAIPKLTEAFAAGTGPDCLAISDIWLAQLAGGGWLESLEPYLADSGLEPEISPASMGIARMYQQTAYYVGFVVEAYTLYYNKLLFAEAGLDGPPIDLDEFRIHAERLTDARRDRYGYYAEGGDGWSFQQWTTWALGTGGLGVDRTFFDANGKCVLNTPAHAQGLQQWLDLYQKSKVSPPTSAVGTFVDQANAFSAGQVAMVFGWGSYVMTMAEAIGQANLGTARTPAGPTGSNYYFAGNGFSINSASPSKEASWEFIEFLLRPENNSEWNRLYGAIPTITRTWEEAWLTQPKYQAILAMLRDGPSLVYHPRYIPGYGSFQSQFSPPQIQKTLLGGQTAQEHLAVIAAALDELRAANG